ncbi:putative bifunctional diguanylate cyclase/phosphodiesterase [Methylocucumis oryzae]|uniref:putative bifunctional diguanylate cyclase/phosphodiesterase n=1 Tax=Methylocucumis oryzae TaxID=1632867 RepID=UPI000698FA39|nr:EAL domain-containing protein [Methylocucumis oryzae]
MVVAPSLPKTQPYHLSPLNLSDHTNPCYCGITSAFKGTRVIAEDLSVYPSHPICSQISKSIGAQACWSEPIFSSTDGLLGVISLYLKEKGEPHATDILLLLQASHLSSIAIERKRIEQKIYHQASYDTLTGLPNRSLLSHRLREEIHQASLNKVGLSLLFIDLDRFKEVNDSLGHDAGDRLLIEASQRIRSCIRDSDTVARLGGDEFVVILAGTNDINAQQRVAQHIVDMMLKPFHLDGQLAYVSASVGIASYPKDAESAELLISCADQAMYAAKNLGRNNFSVFTRDMLEQTLHRQQLFNDLREALNQQQLAVHYQPIIELSTNEVVKAEALVRWHHPKFGMISPALFIPMAEETDLINTIGIWVLREASLMAKRWNLLQPSEPIKKISINMSPRQFVRSYPDIECITHLQNIGLDPKAIVIEITEGLLLDDKAEILSKLNRFSAAGIEVSLDDFGTGYSAMGYLKKFNIDYLKIDRSFINDLESDSSDRAITEAIIVMAHRLGLKVVAEGVETEGQRELLAAVGCEYVQGYLFSKPLNAEDFLVFVQNRHR